MLIHFEEADAANLEFVLTFLERFEKEKNIDVSSISAVYDDKSKTEGIEIVWNSGDRTFITREYIKQRIINEE